MIHGKAPLAQESGPVAGRPNRLPPARRLRDASGCRFAATDVDTHAQSSRCCRRAARIAALLLRIRGCRKCDAGHRPSHLQAGGRKWSWIPREEPCAGTQLEYPAGALRNRAGDGPVLLIIDPPQEAVALDHARRLSVSMLRPRVSGWARSRLMDWVIGLTLPAIAA
jgi:hypothetical protein